MSGNEDELDALVAAVGERLRAGRRVRRRLPGGGRLHVDRRVPFLLLVRGGHDATGVGALVEPHASYLIGGAISDDDLGRIARVVTTALAEEAGACLAIELWETAERSTEDGRARTVRPAFTLVAPEETPIPRVLEVARHELAGCGRGPRRAQVRRRMAAPAPPGREAVVAPGDPSHGGTALLGVEVGPVWRSDEGGVIYPAVLQDLARRTVPAFERIAAAFARSFGRIEVPDPRALGRRTLGGAAWNVDRRLDEVAGSFDFLSLVSPVNVDTAWEEFRRRGGEAAPTFLYRPLPIDPQITKRALFAIPIERVEDVLVATLFREKQEELDRKITMLADRGTRRFLPGSQALYGSVEDREVATAERLLAHLPAAAEESERWVEASQLAERARAEIQAYREQDPSFRPQVEVRRGIPSGLLVSRGTLFVSASARVPETRVAPLLDHEVGTHLLTFHNGRAQRLLVFSSGLAGYEALQEGLAVLAEHLAGGLSAARLRTLAARVLACRWLEDGATFVEAWRRLTRSYGLSDHPAFVVATRVWRGGGLTKDAIYLRGLREVLDYVARGGRLDPLYLGKLATSHLDVVADLAWRAVYREPPLRPRFLARPEGRERLEALRQKADLLDLVNGGMAA